MFATIRRHQKWLWLIIITVVIVSFVIFLDPSYSMGRRGGGGGSGQGSFGSVNGRALSREELMQVYAEVRLRFRLLSDRWPEQDENSRLYFDPDRLMRERLLLLEKLAEFNVQVSDAAVADWIASVFRDRERNAFSLELYRQFVRQVLPQGGMTEADLRRFAAHEVAIQHLLELGSLAGSLVSPAQAEAQYRRENEQVSVEYALLSLSNYLAEVTVEPEALSRFFTNRLAQYRLPERVQVSYVRFETTNFLAEADQLLLQRTNLEQELEATYRRVGEKYFRDAQGNPLSPEAAKQQIKEQERERLAVEAAQRKAMSFAEQLYALYEKEPKGLGLLERLAAASSLVPGQTEPFAQFELPKGLEVSRDFVQAAFALTPEQPMATEPVVGEEAVYIMALQRRLPDEIPAWETVQARVTADFRRQLALQTAHTTGQKFYERLTNGLAEGKTFQALCSEANVLWVKPPPFSFSTRSLPEAGASVNFATLKEISLALPAGETSQLITNTSGAFVVHVTKREPVDAAKMKAELPGYLAQVRENRQREALAEWFRRESAITTFAGLPSFGRSR
jgi:hypothetical protein